MLTCSSLGVVPRPLRALQARTPASRGPNRAYRLQAAAQEPGSGEEPSTSGREAAAASVAAGGADQQAALRQVREGPA